MAYFEFLANNWHWFVIGKLVFWFLLGAWVVWVLRDVRPPAPGSFRRWILSSVEWIDGIRADIRRRRDREKE